MPQWQIIELIFFGSLFLIGSITAMWHLKMGPFQLWWFLGLTVGFFIFLSIPPKLRDEILKPKD